MVKLFIRRPINWMLLVGLLISVFALSACGGSSSTPASSTTASPTTQSNTTTSATTVTIKEQTGTQDVYSFSPASVTIKAGDAVTFDNQSDEYHLLIPTDAAGTPITATDPFTANTIVPTSRASTTTTLQVTFTKAGTYYYTSKLVNRLKDGAHPEGALSQGKGTIIVS